MSGDALFAKSVANIGAKIGILTKCHVFLSQFNNWTKMVNGY